MNKDNILEMKGITKKYPGVLALDSVDFSVKKGSIHALMGENGAGKSTLIKVLTGVIKKDEGTIFLDGQEVDFKSVQQANKLGISAVYQELDLIPEASICENIFLGREHTTKGIINWKKTRNDAEEILKSMNIDLDVKSKLSKISTAMQQMVSIARAISINAKIVVLDEPTSSLDPSEVQVLFKVIRGLKKNNIAVIFITHRLDEVFEVCDDITILKDGKLVSSNKVSNMTQLEMVSQMIGRDASTIINGTQKELVTSGGNVLLKGEKLNAGCKVKNQHIEIKEGEILGLAGLLGSGRTELAKTIFGVNPIKSGLIYMKSRKLKNNTPREAIKEKIAFCSEDRKIEGIIPNMSIKDNMCLASFTKITKNGFISKKKQDEMVKTFVDVMKIKVSDVNAPITSLSGGNQQKVLLARWLMANPELLILDEPTRGIDVGAKKEILDKIKELAKEGISVLMISSILEELVSTCDRVQVIRDGKTIDELDGTNISQDSIMCALAKEVE